MSRKAISIKVSTRAKRLIGKEMNKRQLEGHYRKRMQIVYQSSLGVDNQDIRADLGGSLVTVRKWRLKWQVSEDIILEFEQGYENRKVSDLELIREIKAVLSDAPRPGSPSRISEAEKKRLQALACEAPEKYGLPFTNWTHVELSKQAQRMGITISSSHYGNLLKKTNYVPIDQHIGFSQRSEMKKSLFPELRVSVPFTNSQGIPIMEQS